MNIYESYIDSFLYEDLEIKKGFEDILKLISEYDKNCSNWFEDESFVDKNVPKFNFV